MKPIIALVAVAMLASCSFLPTLRDVQGANDQAIAAWKLAGCAFPLSAIQRNPEVIPALKTLCKSPGGAPASAVVEK